MSEASQLAQRWQAPDVDGPVAGSWQAVDAYHARAQQQQRNEHARGYEAGLHAARLASQEQLKQFEQRVQRLDSIINQLARPLADIDADVTQQLTLLAAAVGRQLAGRELTQDPAQLIAIVRAAIERLPLATRQIRVQLHPEDAAVVRERLAPTSADRAWDLVDDPTLARGDCLIKAESSRVDARLQQRFQAIVASLLGEQREAERIAANAEESK